MRRCQTGLIVSISYLVLTPRLTPIRRATAKFLVDYKISESIKQCMLIIMESTEKEIHTRKYNACKVYPKNRMSNRTYIKEN